MKILFVCLGNICRSPLAEGVMQEILKKAGLEGRISCDSAGTAGYHIGVLPDERSRQTAVSHGFSLTHKARQLSVADYEVFDLILAMDSSIYRYILKICPKEDLKSKVRMFRDFDPEGLGDVEDPYYGTIGDFENVYSVCRRTCQEIVKKIS